MDCEKGHSYSEKIPLKPKKVVFIQNYSISCVLEMGPVTLELFKMWVKSHIIHHESVIDRHPLIHFREKISKFPKKMFFEIFIHLRVRGWPLTGAIILFRSGISKIALVAPFVFS